MTIELNPKEAEALIELLYLGNYMANAVKDDRDERYDELEQRVLSQIEPAVRSKAAMPEEESGDYEYTEDFEDRMMPAIEEFQDVLFWEELIEQLAERDLAKEGKISPAARLDKLTAREDFYEAEFEKNGLDRLVVSR